MVDNLVIGLLAAALLVVFIGFKVKKIIQKNRIAHLDPYKITIKEIDKMEDGKEFEEYLLRFLIELGYLDAYKTVSSRDFGADVVFTDSDGFRNVVQAKRYAPNNQVGLSAVQEVYSSMRYYRAKKSMVISSSFYTDSCETLAGYNGVKLINRNELIEIIDLLQSGRPEEARDIIEAEAHLILHDWSDYLDDTKVIKKDSKAEKRVKAASK